MDMRKTVLVTGGAGYIGSHTLIKLLQYDYFPVVLDNFSNSTPEALVRVKEIAKKSFDAVEGDVRDQQLLTSIFEKYSRQKNPINCIIHFAAHKAVGESVSRPLKYYENNVTGTLTLLAAAKAANVKRFVFSSSATIYGKPHFLPYTEDHPVAPTNPYGWSKAMVEQILKDVCIATPEFSAIALRYFNPIGAHSSGLIGEDPKDEPNNLFPYITQVAVKTRKHLRIFGNDYETPDGTGVRDYIHIEDLAEGHVKAIQYQEEKQQTGFKAFNLGTGRGTSVLQLINAFEEATNTKVAYEFSDRRAGDLAAAWANTSAAENELNWKAKHGLADMCRDGWNWQKNNPHGYCNNNK
ncbi:hypothetical protein AAV94_11620 [Lampropedia cohaerens]|uniref:UDP-glucose 4-epimerase n=1 Tax=Lampropedia cohaerens TaxID=1610491 RepID=A0A0U1PXN2_9BURK|nr:UDP-glucose 4-epimerase GalE [Lampropedia cohaerens]KKW67231.1 hypothetical protein AAV94_11620 [Lampropedia cohaerens]